MRMIATNYFLAAAIAAVVAGSAAHAAPALGGAGHLQAVGNTHLDHATRVAYRTVCDSYGERCRRVWVEDRRYEDDGYAARQAEIRRQQAADAAFLRQQAAERQRALAIKESFARGRPVVVQGARTRNDEPVREGRGN